MPYPCLIQDMQTKMGTSIMYIMQKFLKGIQDTIGEKCFQAVTNEGSIRTFNMQVAKVDKPLLSVSGITRRGNRVVFDPHGSYIENCVTGEYTQIHEVNGMYVLPTWVPGF